MYKNSAQQEQVTFKRVSSLGIWLAFKVWWIMSRNNDNQRVWKRLIISANILIIRAIWKEKKKKKTVLDYLLLVTCVLHCHLLNSSVIMIQRETRRRKLWMRLPWPCEIYLGALDIGLEVALHIHPHWTKFFLGMPILLWKWKFLNLFGEEFLFGHSLSLLMWVTSHCRSESPKTSLCHLQKYNKNSYSAFFPRKDQSLEDMFQKAFEVQEMLV